MLVEGGREREFSHSISCRSLTLVRRGPFPLWASIVPSLKWMRSNLSRYWKIPKCRNFVVYATSKYLISGKKLRNDGNTLPS
ncbi:hypothetical protein IMY05_010G0152200 [Salix suchowensis]|nr:hypothetical protein IMY05_010G0152200 [Salix suchowensis]